jgi:hypothetical protein
MEKNQKPPSITGSIALVCAIVAIGAPIALELYDRKVQAEQGGEEARAADDVTLARGERVPGASPRAKHGPPSWLKRSSSLEVGDSAPGTGLPPGFPPMPRWIKEAKGPEAEATRQEWMDNTTKELERAAEAKPFVLGVVAEEHVAPVAQRAAGWLDAYRSAKGFVREHLWGLGAGALFAIALGWYLRRMVRIWWHNTAVPRMSGHPRKRKERFAQKKFDLLSRMAKRPAGTTFVGMTPRKTFGVFPWWKPVYLTRKQRSMHRHVLGKTGSGKTRSVLWPQVYQDAEEGKGVVVMDAKGSDENVLAMKGIAERVGRRDDLRVLSLPAWNNPRIFSHAYNMVQVRPRTPTDPGGDPAPTAERVFASLNVGTDEYYLNQAQLIFTNLVKVLHGCVDDRGYGLPFNMRDLAICLKGVGAKDEDDAHARALADCLKRTVDQDASRDVTSQIAGLGSEASRCFSGLIAAVEKFQSPIVNAYAPDIDFEEVMEKALMVYVQLPANLFKIQAPALGKIVLMDLQQEGSLRQVHRTSRSQKPFSVTIDEFYNFADRSIIDSLNKLRDANIEYTLAHQSIADLELVSKEFAAAVWDNTRTKEILAQDNPDLCEKIAKSIGTEEQEERTGRKEQVDLATSLYTGDVSSKMVEGYRLHPNCIKNLQPDGQGYLKTDRDILPISYAELPPMAGGFELTRRDQTKARGLRLYERFLAPGANRGKVGPALVPARSEPTAAQKVELKRVHLLAAANEPGEKNRGKEEAGKEAANEVSPTPDGKKAG